MENNNPEIMYKKDNRPMNSILMYAGLYFILPTFIYVILMQFNKDEMFLSSTVNLIIYLIGIVLFVVYLKEYLLTDLNDVKLRNIKLGSSVILGYFVLILSNNVSASIMDVISQFIEIEDTSLNQEAIVQLIKGGYLVPMIITSVICAPFVEELIFRKAIFKLSKKPAIGIIASSFAFGLIHVINGGDYIQSIPYIISGAAFGVIYIMNKENIWPCILVHALSNLISIVGIFLLF